MRMIQRIRTLLVSISQVILGLALIVAARPAFAQTIGAERSQVANTTPARASKAATAKLEAQFGKLPLSFEVNNGQTDRRVQFLTRARGYTLFLTPTEAVLALLRPERQLSSAAQLRFSERKRRTASALRIKLVGANSAPRVEGLDELPGKSDYFIGHDPTKWRTNVPTYSKVKYREVYPGVDLVYYGNDGDLEHDFVVRPGADPRAIRLAVDGAQRAKLGKRGDVEIQVPGGELRLQKPRAYQVFDGVRRSVSARFVATGFHEYGFRLGEYDAGYPVIIDPVLVYSTFLGGSGFDFAIGVAVDAAGSAYVTGLSGSTNFPTTSGAFQSMLAGGSSNVFVVKLNPTGSALVYSTYVGGSGGDFGTGIAVDSSGDAYVTGGTLSGNFPTTSGAFRRTLTAPAGAANAFVIKLNPSGSALVYSTYLGGSGDDRGFGIAIDASGNAYVTGITSSTNFPTTLGAFQTSCLAQRCTPFTGTGAGFVTKLNPSGTGLVYSTYLSGTTGDFNGGRGIAVDVNGNAYVAGETNSSDFPTTRGTFQSASPKNGGICGPSSAYVTKVNASGTGLVYSTYLGGVGSFPSCSTFNDSARAIAIDSAGNAYVTGSTALANFPTTAGAFQTAYGPGTSGVGNNAFVTKLNPLGTALVYSTYLGGSGQDNALGITTDSSGNAYVTGFTTSTNFPVVNAFQSSFGGGTEDGFVAKISADGAGILYSSYLGGNAQDDGFGIAVDSSGAAYVVGPTASSNFPATSGAFQTMYQGGAFDGFVAKIAAQSPTLTTLASSANPSVLAQSVTLTATVAPTSGSGTPTGNVTFSDGATTLATVALSGGQATFTASSLSVGSHSISASYSGDSNFTASTSAPLTQLVQYEPAGTLCAGDAGHQILQPISADGTSVFKQGSTIPAKFRVCDFNGVSIGTAGVVSSFFLTEIIAGTLTTTVEDVVNTNNPDTAFRWDSTNQQWIFNLTTSNLSAGHTYVYTIALNDGTMINFQYGLR